MFKKLAKTVAMVMMAATVATNLSSVMVVEAHTPVVQLTSDEEIHDRINTANHQHKVNRGKAKKAMEKIKKQIPEGSSAAANLTG